MAKILSTIMAIIMVLISSVVPGFVAPGTETLTTENWLYGLDVKFGFTKEEKFDAVKVADEWKVLSDYDVENLDLSKPVTADFVATTLVNAVNLTATEEELAKVNIRNASKLEHFDKVAVAVAKGIISTGTFNTVSLGAMDANEAWTALDKAVKFADEKVFDETAYEIEYVDGVKLVDADFEADGDVITFTEDAGINEGDIFVVDNEAFLAEEVDGNVVTTAPVDAEKVIDTVDYEGSFAPNLAAAVITDGTGEVVSEGASEFATDGLMDEVKGKVSDYLRHADLLQKINISFSVKGFKVKAKVTDSGIKFSISKTLGNGGVNVSKEYDLQDLKFNAKFDASIKSLKFNEVYLTSKYTLVDTTTISGGYVCSLAEKELGEGADAVTFLDRVKQGLFDVKSGESKIDIAKFDIPIGNTSLTISIDLSVVIGVDGSMQVVVTSNNYSGYEIINNKGRFIHDEEKLDKQINAAGDFSVCLGVGLGLGILGYDIVDVNVTGGIGASVYATLKFVDGEGNVITESTLNVAVDAVSAALAGSDLDVDAELNGTVEVYGILKVSVGQNSLISKIGLDKTWTIYDKSNGTFYTYNFAA